MHLLIFSSIEGKQGPHSKVQFHGLLYKGLKVCRSSGYVWQKASLFQSISLSSQGRDTVNRAACKHLTLLVTLVFFFLLSSPISGPRFPLFLPVHTGQSSVKYVERDYSYEHLVLCIALFFSLARRVCIVNRTHSNVFF